MSGATGGAPVPFGLSTWSKPLKAPSLDVRGLPASDFHLVEPQLNARATQGSRPTALNRGLTIPLRPASGVGAVPMLPAARHVPLSKPTAFLKELEQAHIKAMFSSERRANVTSHDLHDNDMTFRNKALVSLVNAAADEFRIDAGLLGEHLVAETRILHHMGMPEVSTKKIGLDDFVAERASINSLVPGAETIRSRPGRPMVAESVGNRWKQMASVPPNEVLANLKPQVMLSPPEAIRASAAYIKYKEALARNALGSHQFNGLIPEIQLQLTRLLVNPGDPGRRKQPQLGTRYWLKEAREGRYESLFDFSPRSLHETTSADVRRRATIHTARALHLAEAVF